MNGMMSFSPSTFDRSSVYKFCISGHSPSNYVGVYQQWQVQAGFLWNWKFVYIIYVNVKSGWEKLKYKIKRLLLSK